MVKTIQMKDSIYRRLSGFGNVGQSFGDVIEDLMDFADGNEEEFEAFIDSKYEEEDNEEEG